MSDTFTDPTFTGIHAGQPRAAPGSRRRSLHETAPLWLNVLAFLPAAALIGWAGSRLERLEDIVSRRTELGFSGRGPRRSRWADGPGEFTLGAEVKPMVISLEKLRKARVSAQDGELGRLEEFYFDDEEWQVRFFIVGTSTFLAREVLISPKSVLAVYPGERGIELDLTREQVKASPPIDLAKPVSRQQAEEYFAYYGWPYFWGAPAGWGLGTLRTQGAPPEATHQPESSGDPHLRSFREVTGYKIHGSDALLGELEDLLVEQESWSIRYLVVDPRSWWPSKKVLLLPGLTDSFDWRTRELRVGLTRKQIQQAPTWDGQPLDREAERRVHVHYGLPPYWSETIDVGAGIPA